MNDEAENLAEWFGLRDRPVEWVQPVKAGNDEDGVPEALLGVEEEG